jgi:transposase
MRLEVLIPLIYFLAMPNLFARFQDESRFGLFTTNGKSLTSINVKPKCKFHQIFKSTWLFGSYSPINGHHFDLILPHCNSGNFQIFLDEMSKEKPTELKIMVLDNGAYHKAKKLIITDNIVLIILPPYSPEVNPSENIWAKYKRAFTNKWFSNLEQVEDSISNQVVTITQKEVMSICGFPYVFSNQIWTI